MREEIKQLLDKYTSDTLTPEGLAQLRASLEILPDSELEKEMKGVWNLSDFPDADISTQEMERILEGANKRTSVKRPPISLPKLLAYAASLLIPLLLFSTFYFYQESRVVASSDMVIRTQKGERVSITLPDGTHVDLNSESKLQYRPTDFNKSSRPISFEGEALFKVATDLKKPFVITTDKIQLEVLGTEFNLLSRNHFKNIEVTLLEGHVLLTDTEGAGRQELFANEKAIFSKSARRFTVERSQSRPEIIWKQQLIYLKNAHFGQVLQELEMFYNVAFVVEDSSCIKGDTFTGLLPSDDIGKAMDILKKCYDIDYQILSDQIRINTVK